MSREAYSPKHVTWAALLGRWVEFARSAVGLPADEQGGRLRRSVPDMIMLQAVWFALRQMEDLPDDERRLGLDRAEILIDRHSAALRERWNGVLPRQLRELIDDARAALAAQQAVQVERAPDLKDHQV